ncbi:MAG: hypothetical protein AAGA19_02570 [Pseudomonadota bacterium]
MTVLRAAALVLLLAPAAHSQSPIEDPAFDFCVTRTEGTPERALCIEEWRRAMQLVLEYGQDKGFLDQEGVLDSGAMLKATANWQTLLGLPPPDPFPRCMGRTPMFAPLDFREIWACIKRFDPDAAKRDAI